MNFILIEKYSKQIKTNIKFNKNTKRYETVT